MPLSSEPDAGVLIAGCGYVGCRLASLMANDGVPVWGLKRDPASLPAGVRPVAADVTDPQSLSRGLNGIHPAPAALVYAIAPPGPSADDYQAAYVDGLRNVIAALPAPPRRLVLVSSTGVYGHADGRWVDEDTDPEPADESARRILDGEDLAVSGAATGIVLRLGGIYGPGRTRTVRQVLSGEARCPPADRYGNRIHRDDAAAALRHLLRLERPHATYIGVDRDPAPLRDVYAWVARRAGVPDPCEEEGGPASHDPAPGRRGSNKRCSSRRLVESGFAFRYPTYREGYGALIQELA